MRFLADENFDNRILRGIRREDAEADIVRVQDTEIYMADDPTVLEWAAKEGRIVLTHDIKTMPKYAYERVKEEKLMLGVIAVHDDAPIGEVIEDLLLSLEIDDPSEFVNQVVFLPL
jgi:hypothetical protein